MKYSIIIDSVGCLPESEFKSRPIELLPLVVTFDGVKYVDTYEAKALTPIHTAGRVGVKSDSVSITPLPDDVRKFMLRHITQKYDFAIGQTVGKSYTPILDSFKAVADSIAADAKSSRAKSNISTPFRMTAMETGTVVAGQGLIALYSDDLLKSGMSFNDFKPVIQDFRTMVKTFIIVRDSVYARHRQKQKGNKTVSLPVAHLANALKLSPITLAQNNQIDVIDLKTRGFESSIEKVLDYCCDRVKEGLVAPLINISFAGDTASLTKHNSFKKLQHVCDDAKVKLYVGVMCLAASINTGPGALSIGIAPVNQEALP